MKALWYGVSAFVIFAAACDPGPADPAFTFPRITASYVLIPAPGGNVDSVGCGLYEAYEFSDHFLLPNEDSNRVRFFAGGTARPRCGDLDFLQDTAPTGDTAHFSYIVDVGGSWHWWIRRTRRTSQPYDFVQNTMAIDSIPMDTRHDTGFSAPRSTASISRPSPSTTPRHGAACSPWASTAPPSLTVRRSTPRRICGASSPRRPA